MDDFDRFWTQYPKRLGANPKTVARQKFMRAVASGVSPELIISGVKAYARELDKKVGTEFVAMASTWLNQRRWGDYEQEQIVIHNLPTKVFVPVDSPAWAAWSKLRRWPQSDFKIDGRYQRVGGTSTASGRKGNMETQEQPSRVATSRFG